MSEVYAVTGASGNTGTVVTEELLSAGKEVRVIARNADKLTQLEKKGAKVLAGDISDTAFLEKAFQGTTGVYAMIPPNYGAADTRAYQEGIGASIVAALKKTKVPHVVALSSIGAHLPKDAGIVQALHTFENQLGGVDGNVLSLRAGYFMENLFMQIGTIKHMGIMGSPLRGDLKIPMVASRDIGLKAAAHLLKKDFSGKSAGYVLGSRDVSYDEIAGIFGRLVGKADLKYVQFPYEDAQKAMEQAGLSASSAAALVQLTRVMNDGSALNAHKRDATNTTPTAVEDFAKIFAGAFSAAA